MLLLVLPEVEHHARQQQPKHFSLLHGKRNGKELQLLHEKEGQGIPVILCPIAETFGA